MEEAIRSDWPIQSPDLKALLAEGWTIPGVLEKFKQDSNCTFSLLLGKLPHGESSAALPGTGASADDGLPAFSVEAMHRQIVKFIVADDQVSIYLFSTAVVLIGVFSRLM
jgi:hypothetical protein